tara:strand:- start:2054 stop:2242 length:189 start_codon:yes stop_codon:yes gene_type:complete
MEDTLLKIDYTNNHGRIYPAGTYIACDRETYLKLLEAGHCEPHKEDKKVRKSKKTKKDGSNK